MTQHLGIDGFPRSKENDEIISKNFQSLFNTPSGKAVLAYLRSITLDLVSGPNSSDGEIRHREGQRFIVAIIEKLIEHAQRIKNNE